MCHCGVCVCTWMEKKETSTKFEFMLQFQKKKMAQVLNIVFRHCVLGQTLQDKWLLRPEKTLCRAIQCECKWKPGLSPANPTPCRTHAACISTSLFRVVKGVMQDKPDWRRAQIKEDSFLLRCLLLCLCYSVWHSGSHLCCVDFAVWHIIQDNILWNWHSSSTSIHALMSSMVFNVRHTVSSSVV